MAKHHVFTGTGPTVVALHGIGGGFDDTFTANGWTEHLTTTGRRIVGVDALRVADVNELRGRRYESDLRDLFSFGETDVIGFSMGAGHALRLVAGASHDIRRVVLLGVNPVALAAAGWFHTSATDARRDLAGSHAFIRGVVEPQDYVDAQFEAWASDSIDPIPALGGVEALFITGADDGPALPIAADLAARVGAEHVVIEGCDHTGLLGSVDARDRAIAWVTND